MGNGSGSRTRVHYGAPGGNAGWQQSTGLLRLDRFESVPPEYQKREPPVGVLFFGAGDRTRTGTLSPAVDFEGVNPAGNLWNRVELSGIFHPTKCSKSIAFHLKSDFSLKKQVKSCIKRILQCEPICGTFFAPGRDIGGMRHDLHNAKLSVNDFIVTAFPVIGKKFLRGLIL